MERDLGCSRQEPGRMRLAPSARGSARNERTAFWGTLGGGLFYFGFAFVPMFIAYAATVIDPTYQEHFQATDARDVQKILPMLVLAGIGALLGRRALDLAWD